MGMRGEAGNVQSSGNTVLVLAGLLAAAFSAGTALAQSDAQDSAFQYEERSTIHTIQLNSMEEETLANTVIEGGLAAPAAGVPLKPRVEDDFYLADHRFRWSSGSAIRNPFPDRPTATIT